MPHSPLHSSSGQGQIHGLSSLAPLSAWRPQAPATANDPGAAFGTAVAGRLISTFTPPTGHVVALDYPAATAQAAVSLGRHITLIVTQRHHQEALERSIEPRMSPTRRNAARVIHRRPEQIPGLLRDPAWRASLIIAGVSAPGQPIDPGIDWHQLIAGCAIALASQGFLAVTVTSLDTSGGFADTISDTIATARGHACATTTTSSPSATGYTRHPQASPVPPRERARSPIPYLPATLTSLSSLPLEPPMPNHPQSGPGHPPAAPAAGRDPIDASAAVAAPDTATGRPERIDVDRYGFDIRELADYANPTEAERTSGSYWRAEAMGAQPADLTHNSAISGKVNSHAAPASGSEAAGQRSQPEPDKSPWNTNSVPKLCLLDAGQGRHRRIESIAAHIAISSFSAPGDVIVDADYNVNSVVISEANMHSRIGLSIQRLRAIERREQTGKRSGRTGDHSRVLDVSKDGDAILGRKRGTAALAFITARLTAPRKHASTPPTEFDPAYGQDASETSLDSSVYRRLRQCVIALRDGGIAVMYAPRFRRHGELTDTPGLAIAALRLHGFTIIDRIPVVLGPPRPPAIEPFSGFCRSYPGRDRWWPHHLAIHNDLIIAVVNR